MAGYYVEMSPDLKGSLPMSNLRPAACLITSIAALGFGLGAVAATKNLLKNGDFEAPSLTANPPPHFGKKADVVLPYYVRPYGKSDSWSYPDGDGFLNTTTSGNPWYNGALPTGFSGVQFAFLQNSTTITQTFKVKTAGTYQVAWLDAGRPDGGSFDGNQGYALLLNGVNEGNFQTTSGQNFTPESVQVLLAAGTNVISFVGMPPDGNDHTAFLDAVSVKFMP